MTGLLICVALTCQSGNLNRETSIRASLDYLEGSINISLRVYLGEHRHEARLRDRDDAKLRRYIMRKFRITEQEMTAVIRAIREDSENDFHQILTALKLIQRLEEEDVPLKLGTARVSTTKCTCGTTIGRAAAFSDPAKIRHCDDVSPSHDCEKPHTQELHNMDGRDDQNLAAVGLYFWNKIAIQEVIRPNDPRYNNHETWVRGLVGGKTMYVQGRGLRNTEF